MLNRLRKAWEYSRVKEVKTEWGTFKLNANGLWFTDVDNLEIAEKIKSELELNHGLASMISNYYSVKDNKTMYRIMVLVPYAILRNPVLHKMLKDI